MSHQYAGSKLSSNCQVSSSLFYNKWEVKLETRNAARLTMLEILLFGQKAKIPTTHLKDCMVIGEA